MFRSFARTFLPNPFDWMLKRTARKGGKKILLVWNRGLGDIALGLYAMVQRIREYIPDAEIVFLTRENLLSGFSMLEGVKAIGAPHWKRGEPIHVKESLLALNLNPADFDLIIERPSPTDWVRWQRGKVVPKLKWDSEHEELWRKFDLPDGYTYVGVQVTAETQYGLWRNWPLESWQRLFESLESQKNVRVLLFGFGDKPAFKHKVIIDLRGKTTLFEMLSIIKNRCHTLVLPDSGILSMSYYLDASFPIQIVSLWADPDHGILKQNVPSPNPKLSHVPLIGQHRDLSVVSVEAVLDRLFPPRPLQSCPFASSMPRKPVEKAGCIILAGGQGSRLGLPGPKGIFPISGKSLFQWICEKTEYKEGPVAVMTSPLNHLETVAFFEQHSYFGLDIHFFQQEMRPLLDEEKRPIELRPGEIVQGPNGNGSLFRSFVKAGLSDLFASRGVDLVSIVPVENPLADLYDPVLIAYHRSEEADVTIKCIERGEDRTMGVLVERKGKIEIVEYTEAPSGDYRYANTGQLVFSLPFLTQMASCELPLHWVRKQAQIGGQMMWVWKGEHFIFDVLPYANRVRALCAAREVCYAPLKHRENLEAVENAMIKQKV